MKLRCGLLKTVFLLISLLCTYAPESYAEDLISVILTSPNLNMTSPGPNCGGVIDFLGCINSTFRKTSVVIDWAFYNDNSSSRSYPTHLYIFENDPLADDLLASYVQNYTYGARQTTPKQYTFTQVPLSYWAYCDEPSEVGEFYGKVWVESDGPDETMSSYDYLSPHSYYYCNEKTDNTAPSNVSISINSGGTSTNNRTVSVSISGKDNIGITAYHLSESSSTPSGDPTKSSWTSVTSTTSYSNTVSYTFGSDGAKTLYVWFKDAFRNVSARGTSNAITVDATKPTDGTLTAAAGDKQVSLNWSGFKDGGSGIGAYFLVSAANSAPASCAGYPRLFTDTEKSFVDTGLTDGTLYCYRLCGQDKAGNTSAGATACAAPFVSVTVASSPSGRQVTADGQSHTAPKTFRWTPGSSHTVGVSSPQGINTYERYVYNSWSDGQGQSHSITVPSTAATYTATFTKQFYTEIINSPDKGGSVVVTPPGSAVSGTIGGVWHDDGIKISLQANANSGCAFTSWSGSVVSGMNPTPQFTINKHFEVWTNYNCAGQDITAPDLTITSHAHNQRVTATPITLSGTASDARVGNNGIQQVTVKGARASSDTATGNGTANWSRSVDLSSGANVIQVIAYDNSPNHNQALNNLTIYLDPPNPTTYVLTVNSKNPENGVLIDVSPPDNGSLYNGPTPLNRTYNANAQVTLIAPQTVGGKYFSSWSDCPTSFSTSCSVTMTGPKTVTANYAIPTPTTYVLTVASTNPANGVGITVSPADNAGNGSGSTEFPLTYNANAQVTLTAPQTVGGNTFGGWSGCTSASGTACYVTMTGTIKVTANYIAPPPPSGSGFKLPDTGQKKCYDAGGAEITPCPVPGNQLAQDGSYPRNPLAYEDIGGNQVLDNNTGLIWQKCSIGQSNDASCSGSPSYRNWYQASGTYDASYNPTSVNDCGALGAGWRLPSKQELMSIVDYSVPYPGPTIDGIFVNTPQYSNYWSATTPAVLPSHAWGVGFSLGLVGTDYKNNRLYVRCVRSGQ